LIINNPLRKPQILLARGLIPIPRNIPSLSLLSASQACEGQPLKPEFLSQNLEQKRPITRGDYTERQLPQRPSMSRGKDRERGGVVETDVGKCEVC